MFTPAKAAQKKGDRVKTALLETALEKFVVHGNSECYPESGFIFQKEYPARFIGRYTRILRN
jgi:hypothetical protein